MNKAPNKKDAPIQFVQTETAWTINTLAKVAREHRMKTMCEQHLAKMYKLSSVDPADLFTKAREQVLCYMQLRPTELETQLEIIKGTNLQYFVNQQSAEIFALKGMVLHKLGKWKDANKAFSTGVSLCDDLGMAWEAWAVYCDDMFKRVRESVRLLKVKKSEKKSNDASTEVNAREWGKAAITCYLNACRSYLDDEKSKKVISRSLMMLSMDDQSKVIGTEFGKLAESLDVAIWRFWIPELVTSLSRPEAKFVHGILVRLAKMYPQAIYCNLRTAFLEIRASEGQTQMKAARRASTAASATAANQASAPDSADQARKKRRTDSDGQTPVADDAVPLGSSKKRPMESPTLADGKKPKLEPGTQDETRAQDTGRTEDGAASKKAEDIIFTKMW